MNYWLFQANPKYYRVLDAINDLDVLYWTVNAFYKQIAISDRVLIWVCGESAGIYATAEVLVSPQQLSQTPEASYWLDPRRALNKYFTQIRFIKKLLDTPLLKTNIIDQPSLHRFPVFRYPNAVDYKLTQEEWEKVSQLIDKLET